MLDFLAEAILNINALNLNNKKFLLARLLKENEALEKILKGYEKFLNRSNDVISPDCGLELPELNNIVGHFLDQYLINKVERAIQDLEVVTDERFRAASILRVVEIIGEAASQMSRPLRVWGDFPFWAAPTTGSNKSLAHDLRTLIQHHRRELSLMGNLDPTQYAEFVGQCQEYINLAQEHIEKIKEYLERSFVVLFKSSEVQLPHKNIISTDLFTKLNKFCERFWKGILINVDTKVVKGSKNKGAQAQDDVKKFKDIKAVYFEDLVERLLREGSETSQKLAHFLYDVISGETDQDRLREYLPSGEEQLWLRSSGYQEVQEIFFQITRRVGFTLLRKKGLVVGGEPSGEDCETWSVLRKALQFFLGGTLGPLEISIYTVHELASYSKEKKLYLEPELLTQLKVLYRARINGVKEVSLGKELAEIVGLKDSLLQALFDLKEKDDNDFYSAIKFFESSLKSFFKNNQVQDPGGKIKEKLLYLFCGEQYRNNRVQYDVAVASVLSEISPSKKYQALKNFIGIEVDAYKKPDVDIFCAHFFIQDITGLQVAASSLSLSLHDCRAMLRRAIQKLDGLVKSVNVAGWAQVHLAAEFFMEDAGALAENFYREQQPSNSKDLELSPRYFAVLAQFRKKMAHHYQGVNSLELRHLLEKSCLITGPLLQAMDMKPGDAAKPLDLIDDKDKIIARILSFGFGFNIRVIGSHVACDFGVQADLNLLVEEAGAESPDSAGSLMGLSIALSHFLNRDVRVFTEASLRESCKTKVSEAQINRLVSTAIDFEDYIENIRYEKIIKKSPAYSSIRMHDGAVLTYRDMQNAAVVKEMLQYLFPGREVFSDLFDVEDLRGCLEQVLSQRIDKYESSPNLYKTELLKFIDGFLNRLVFEVKFKCFPLVLRIPGEQDRRFPDFYGQDFSGLHRQVSGSQVSDTIADLESRGGQDFFYDCYLPADDENGIMTHYTLFSVSINQNCENIKTGGGY